MKKRVFLPAVNLVCRNRASGALHRHQLSFELFDCLRGEAARDVGFDVQKYNLPGSPNWQLSNCFIPLVEYRNDAENRELFASDAMPHFA